MIRSIECGCEKNTKKQENKFITMILPDEIKWLPDGIQRHYWFDDGWGASVICRKETSAGGTEGLWELAPLRYGHLLKGAGDDIGLYDVKGYLNDAQLQEELHKLRNYGRKTYLL